MSAAKYKAAIARIILSIVAECNETGLLPLVIVYGKPRGEKTDPLKVTTAFDVTTPETFCDQSNQRFPMIPRPNPPRLLIACGCGILVGGAVAILVALLALGFIEKAFHNLP